MNYDKLQERFFMMFLLLCLPILGFSQNNEEKFMEAIDIKGLNLGDQQVTLLKSIKSNHLTKAVYGLSIVNISKVVSSNHGTLPIKLPGFIKAIVACPKEFEYFSDDDYKWYGEFEQEPGDILIRCNDGAFTGQISIEDKVYEFRTLDKGKNILIEYDVAQLNQEGDIPLKTSIIQKPLITQTSSSPAVINILFLYTPRAVTFIGAQNIQQHAQSAVDQMQTALDESVPAGNVTISIAAVETWNFTETWNDIKKDWDSLRTSGYVEGRRNTSSADLVVLITDAPTEHHGYDLGQAPDHYYVAGFSGEANPGFAHAIVEANFATNNKTFSHEVGHLLGCDHEKQPGEGGYNHGYNFYVPPPSGKSSLLLSSPHYRTIMHTPYLNSVRITRFSNPDVYYSGVACGVINTNDNAREIENTALSISRYRPMAKFNATIPLSTLISGPTEVGAYTENTWTVNVTDTKASLKYQWNYSLDGIDYSNSFGKNQSITEKLVLTSGYIFLKVTVISGDNETAVSFHTVHVSPLGPLVIYKLDKDFTKLKSGISETAIQLSENSLEPNSITIYPNPVSASTAIHYQIDKPSYVKIYITDYTGRVFKTIQDGQQSQGSYNFRLWSLSIKSGIYFCIVKTGDNLITKKLIVQ